MSENKAKNNQINWQEWIVDSEDNYDFLSDLNLVFNRPDDKDFDFADQKEHERSQTCCHHHDAQTSESCQNLPEQSNETRQNIEQKLNLFLKTMQKWTGENSVFEQRLKNAMPKFVDWLCIHPSLFEKMVLLQHEIEICFDLQQDWMKQFSEMRKAVCTQLKTEPQLSEEIAAMRTALFWWYVRHPEHFKKAVLAWTHFLRWLRTHPTTAKKVTEILTPAITEITQNVQIVYQLFLLRLLLLKWVHDHHEQIIQMKKIWQNMLIWARKHVDFLKEVFMLGKTLNETLPDDSPVRQQIKQVKRDAFAEMFKDYPEEWSLLTNTLLPQIKQLFSAFPKFSCACRQALKTMIFSVITESPKFKR